MSDLQVKYKASMSKPSANRNIFDEKAAVLSLKKQESLPSNPIKEIKGLVDTALLLGSTSPKRA